jgi:ribosomal protein S12
MNAKKLLIGLLTATVVITPFANLQPASATDNVTNSTVTPIQGQTGMLLMAKGKGKSGKKGIMIRGGRVKDIPGRRYHIVKGTFSGVAKNIKKFGIKK